VAPRIRRKASQKLNGFHGYPVYGDDLLKVLVEDDPEFQDSTLGLLFHYNPLS